MDSGKSTELHASFGDRAKREAIAWFWILLAFLFIYSCIGQARVIPSESMENTLLVGDHLIMSRFGYDAGLPFMQYHIPLWRNPKRQQIVIIRTHLNDDNPDLIKRVIGMPGDTLEIHEGAVWINGQRLDEPYIKEPMGPYEHFGPVKVPPDSYFAMGDNRADSYDSRYWGAFPRSALIGVPVMIYLSIDAPKKDDEIRTEAWEPGHLVERFEAYAYAVIHPSHIRWKRLFHFF
jgi:signal peptidase I